MTDKPDPLQELQNLTADELVEQLPALTDGELGGVYALEVADKGGRKGVLKALGAELKQRGLEPTAAAPAAGATAAASDAWRAEDYTGPLTADQASWRNATFKPVQVARTK